MAFRMIYTIALIFFFCFVVAPDVNAAKIADTVIPTKVHDVLERYASTIGCEFSFDKENVVQFDVDDNGTNEFIAVFFLDVGCSGGTAMGTSIFAVLDLDDHGRLLVRSVQSQPAIASFGFPRFIDKIFLKQGKLYYSAKDYDWSKDALCCPSLQIEDSFSLRKSVVIASNGESLEIWYWMSEGSH